jgi:hypothetical protein
MLKHDYINILCNRKCKPSHHNSLIFLMQAYPGHYIIMCWLSYTIYHIMLYMRLLLSTIMKNLETEVDDIPVAANPMLVGGGRKLHITYGMLCPYILLNGPDANIEDSIRYHFVSHIPHQNAIDTTSQNSELLVCCMPLGSIIEHLTIHRTKSVAKIHGAFVAYKALQPSIIKTLTGHLCSKHCYDNVFVFKPALDDSIGTWKDGIDRARHRKNKNKSYSHTRGKSSFKEMKALQNKKYYRNNKALWPGWRGWVTICPTQFVGCSPLQPFAGCGCAAAVVRLPVWGVATHPCCDPEEVILPLRGGGGFTVV